MIESLDLLRSKILKETMKVSFFRSIFLNRSYRILTLAFLALSIYLAASLFFPMWVLLIGPILWGVPHIVASFRYNFQIAGDFSLRKNLIYLQSALWLCVFAYRISIDVYNISLPLANAPLLFECICLVISFLVQIYLTKKWTLNLIIFNNLFAILILSTYLFPIQTGLFLLIGHNYIPLYAWYKSCSDKNDLRIFSVVTVAYIAISVCIFAGSFDFLYSHFSPQGSIKFLNWNYADIAKTFGASNADYKFWFHIVSLYAFSQAMHYFMWLKAIPENYQPQQYPPSFRWTFNRFANEFGSSSIILMLSIITVGLLYWFFLEFQTARLVYFSIASYHGFMEFSALPFLKSNRKSDS